MTHDELLEQIDNFIQYTNNLNGGQALRAVIQLHKPEIYKGKETGRCVAHEECWGCGEWEELKNCPCNSYPCTTIQAIETALNA